MARRTWAQLAALLADNNTGEISEADLRDAVIDSAMPHVEARPPSSSDHEGAGFDVGHTWIDSSASPMPEAWRCVFSSPSAAIWSRIEGQKGDPGDPGSPGANGADGTPQWMGAWSAGTYAAGEAVSHDGSSYVANTSTTEEPPHSDWDVLAAKGDSGGGASAFTDLSDAPSSYSGAGGKVVAVTSGADGLEFIDAPSGGASWGGITGTLSDQTDLQAALDDKLSLLSPPQNYSGNRTLDASNSGRILRFTDEATVTLPNGLADGFQCVIVNATASDVVDLDAATTLTLPSGFEPEVVNRRAVTLLHVGSNVWEAYGALVETP